MPTFTEQTARDFWASLDERSKLALAKTAPRVAGKWERLNQSAGGNRNWVRGNFHEDRAFLGVGDFARILGPRFGKWTADIDGGVRVGQYDDIESAKSAVDVRLREMGFVLEDGE